MKPNRGSEPRQVESVKIIRETIVAMCRVDEKRIAEDHARALRTTGAEERIG
jgi:hypothetical protein